jgi:uroporphyrinogen-III synthase
MAVLVTRPQPEADALCGRLAAMGRTAIVDPLLTVEFLDFVMGAPERYAAVAVTSRNALRGLERHPELLASLRTKPLFAVGAATGSVARGIGFSDVIEGPGAASALSHLIGDRLGAARGTILVLATETPAFDLPVDLRGLGFEVEARVVYRTSPAAQLRPETLTALTVGAIDAVMLMSARTARTYAALIVMHNQLERIRDIPHLCLSDAVAEPLASLGPLIVLKAAYPNLEELLALAASAAKPSA